MNRYHKKIYFPDVDILDDITSKLNNLEWNYSKHCLDNLKYRTANIEDVLKTIKNSQLQAQDIFEYYKDAQGISKLCYRISYSDTNDIILVISKDKNIITVYFNSVDDDHFTLKNNLYNTERI